MTECSQEAFAFASHFSRRVEAGFTAGQVCTDGGSLLLREVERRINLLGRLAGCFRDGRRPLLVKHRLVEMLSQRIYGLALGYEDLCDHQQLRSDPLFGLLSGKRELDEPLAGKSTLNRLELTGRSLRYHKISFSTEAIDRLLVDLYIESQATAPEQIVLDLDATDIPLYGHQPERFFHGYYDHYCYLPLYIFAGDQLLCARLRPANRRNPPEQDHRRPDAASSQPASEHRPGRARLHRVPVHDPQKLVHHAPRGGQGRISGQGGEPALRGHVDARQRVGRERLIREVLLRSRRDGEPHQGADVPVRRPALHQRDQGQPVAPLLLRHRLYADGSPAEAGSQRHRVGTSTGRYHPS